MGWRRLPPIASNIVCSVWWCIFYFMLTLRTRTWPGKHLRIDSQEKKANKSDYAASRECFPDTVSVYVWMFMRLAVAMCWASVGTDDFQCVFCCVASYTENFLFKVFCCDFHRFSYFPTVFTCSSQSRFSIFSAFDAICRSFDNL